MDDSQAQRYAAVIDRIKADGAAAGLGPDELHAKIMDFVQQAKAQTPAVDPRQAALQAGINKQRAKVAEQNAKPDPMSFGEVAGAIGDELGDRLAGMGRGALTIGKAAWSPIDTITTPEKRRQLERGVDDIVTLGYGQKLAARIGNALGDVERGQSLDETKHFSRNYKQGDTDTPSLVQATDAAVAPGYREAGSLAGMFIPGAGNAIGRGGGAIAGKLIGPGKTLLGNVVRGAGRTALGYELAAPAIAAASADAAGNRGEAALHAALDPAGLAMAGGTAVAGAGLRAGERAIRSNKTMGGYLASKEKGTYERPDMTEVGGEEGMRKMAETGLTDIARRQLELERANGERYDRALNPQGPKPPPPGVDYAEMSPLRGNQGDQTMEEIVRDLPAAPGRENASSLLSAAKRTYAPTEESPQQAARWEPLVPTPQEPMPALGLDRPINRDLVIAELNRARARNINRDNGIPYDKTLDKKFETAIQSLGPGGEYTNAGSDVTRWVEQPNTAGGTLGIRRAWKEKSGWDAVSATDDQKESRKVYNALRAGIHDAAPDIRDADNAYSKDAKALARDRSIIFNTEDQVIRPQGGPGGELRQGPDIEMSDARGEPHEIGAHPQTGEPDIDPGKFKTGATTLGRYGDTNVPGLQAKRFLDELHGRDAEYARALDDIKAKKDLEGTRFGFDGHLPTSLHTATAVLGPAMRQNARAIGVRAVPVLQAGQTAAGAASQAVPLAAANPLTRAYAQDGERKRLMAALLMQMLRSGLGQQ